MEDGDHNTYKNDMLPDVVVREIFRNLGARDSLAASQTCKRWRSIGVPLRPEIRTLRVSDFYKDLIKERQLEFPVFHRRKELAGLILIFNKEVKKLLVWFAKLFPNVINLIFRNHVPRLKTTEWVCHPSRYHVFIVNELMGLIGKLYPNLELLDVSAEIVDVRALHWIKRWPKFREIRLSGSDLSYNMLTQRYLVSEALAKTFWTFPLEAIRLSNMEIKFDLTFKKMTKFRAIKNKSLTTAWLRDFLNEAVNLETLALDCQYLHNENVAAIGNLTKLRDLTLRNCLYVTDFAPLAGLSQLHTMVIDMGDKGGEEQLIEIIRGSKNWRAVVLNETIEAIGDKFFFAAAEHFRQHSCPVQVFEINTEKTEFPFVHHDWVLPTASMDSLAAVLEACPLLETFGVCSGNIEDKLLFKIVESCPRIRSVVLNHSSVSDDGVLEFYDYLLEKRAESFAGIDWKEMYINVWNAEKCTPNLRAEAEKLYGRYFGICM